jgi:hypothetical protein
MVDCNYFKKAQSLPHFPLIYCSRSGAGCNTLAQEQNREEEELLLPPLSDASIGFNFGKGERAAAAINFMRPAAGSHTPERKSLPMCVPSLCVHCLFWQTKGEGTSAKKDCNAKRGIQHA